jgi:ion channel-forming bestrophin family protein
MTGYEPRQFWRDVFAIEQSESPSVLARVAEFGLFALLVYLINDHTPLDLGIDVAPYEVAGVALGVLLVLRTNSGYDRWWEARRLWGGIVNQCRNLAIAAIAYGPADAQWRAQVIRWTAALEHVCRRSLRGERDLPEVAALLGEADAHRIARAEHMPSFVSARLAELLRQGRDELGMDPFAFLQIDRERATLIDHLGGCERILATPLPRIYAIHIRRFIFLYLTTLPFAMLNKIGWMTTPVTVVVAYVILSLDQIGVELQNPFVKKNMGHLPLDELTSKIEVNLRALLAAEPTAPAPDPGAGHAALTGRGAGG